jgi:hypothetical protein
MWDFARRERKNGNFSGLTGEDLAIQFGTDPETGDELIEHLVATGWLDRTENGLFIHHWLDHCEWYVIRDLIGAKELPEGWERGDPVPETVFFGHPNGQLDETSCDPVGKSCDLSQQVALTRGEGEGEGEVKKGKGKREGKSQLDSPEFQSFWALDWKRKRSKGDARKAWKRAIQKTSHETILKAARAFVASPEGRGEYSPRPSSWLNQERWDDDPASWQNSGDDREGVKDVKKLILGKKDA